LLRYADEPASARSGYTGLAVALLLGAGAEYLDYWFWLAHPPVTTADGWAFLFFQGLPLIFWLGGGLPALAKTRKTYGRHIHGTIYDDHRPLFNPKRYDLAKVSKVWVNAGDHEYGSFFYLGLRFPATPSAASIRLPISTERPEACSDRDRALVLALADALAEHPNHNITERAVADLRFLATASGQQANGWVADLIRRRGFRARRQRRKQQQS
jgi:hypothetical protein